MTPSTGSTGTVTLTLSELAAAIGAEVAGDGQAAVSSCATLDDAQPGQVSFLANPKYAKQQA